MLNLRDISKKLSVESVSKKDLKNQLELLTEMLQDQGKRLSELEVLSVNIQNNQDFLGENLYSAITASNASCKGLIKNYSNLELLHLPHTEKKRLLIIGFYGAPNLGDELMLETLLSYLEGREDLEITAMLCDNPDYDYKKYGGINFIHYPNSKWDFNFIASYFDIVMFGGGAIIDDSLYDEKKPDLNDLGTLLIEISLRTLAFGKDLLCVGLSTSDKLENPKYIEYLRKIVKGSKYFSLRDEQSTIIIKGIVKNLGQLITTEDIVLANKEFDLEKGKNKKAFEVGVNLICNEETKDHFEIILDNLISFLDLENVKDYFIKLIPFYTYSNNDIKYYEEIIQKGKYKEVVSIEKEPSGMSDLLEIFSSKSLVVSMRYHCSLISLILGIPTLTIEYDTHQHYPNKTLYLKNILEANRIKFSTLDEENIIKGLQKTLGSKMDLKSRDEILKSAKKSLNKVLSYI